MEYTLKKNPHMFLQCSYHINTCDKDVELIWRSITAML